VEDYLKTKYDLNDSSIVSVIDELPLWSAPFGLDLLDKIKYRKNITALDIGPGLGFPLLEIAMRLGGTCRVYGIDPWEKAMERIRKKIKIYGISNVQLISGVAEKIPIPDNSVDLIFSNNGLNNVGDLGLVLKECNRVSKTGAQLVFTFNTDKTMIEFYTVLESVMHEKKMQDEISLMNNHIYKKRKPVQEYLEILGENGYVINEIFHNKFEYCFVDGRTMFNHFLIKLAFIESWKELIPKERQVEIFGEVERRLNEFANNNGLLKLTIPFLLIDCQKT